MGRRVTLASQSMAPIAGGVSRADVTVGDTSEFSAEFLRLEPSSSWSATVPPMTDGYLFVLSGEIEIATGSDSHRCETESFITVREGIEFSLKNNSSRVAEVLSVQTLPEGSSGKLAGLDEDIVVRRREDAPTMYIPDQKKNRVYFVSKEASKSERAHAMIVEYEEQTLTPMHHHPNAESIFIMLSGEINFVINQANIVLTRGEVAYFGSNDRHALQCADGVKSASFLEFHIPGSFTTVK